MQQIIHAVVQLYRHVGIQLLLQPGSSWTSVQNIGISIAMAIMSELYSYKYSKMPLTQLLMVILAAVYYIRMRTKPASR